MSICNKKLKKKLKRAFICHRFEAMRKKQRELRLHELKKQMRSFGLIVKPKYIRSPEWHELTSDEDNDLDFINSGKKIDEIKCRKRRNSSHI
jgi:hypothetical protein